MSSLPHIVLQRDGQWFSFQNPIRIIQADESDEVPGVLEQVDEHVSAGQYAAGFLAYEASAAFDHCLEVHPYPDGPFAWFAIYDEILEGQHAPPTNHTVPPANWLSTLDAEAFATSIDKIKTYIASGDTYQVNYTFPLKTTLEGSLWPLFQQMTRMQTSRHAAYIDTGQSVICSASPELFFKKSGQTVTCRPMKGTRKRGLTFDEDERLFHQLQHAPKDRSENIMIVDMIRNDLGKIAEPGSVKTTRIFDVEKYETVFQMVSEVQAHSDAGLLDLFRALYPCASITGAPKVRTMQIIRELENGPRGVYTGTIGSILPGGDAEFNVAIRTVQFDRTSGNARYDTGSGIVWDSDPDSEYQECLSKTRVLTGTQPEFDLLETILWEPTSGYLVLPYHYERLNRSAKYFNFTVDLEAIDRKLSNLGIGFPPECHRIRLTVSRDGTFDIQTRIVIEKDHHFNVVLDDRAIDTSDPFLYHKTTYRDIYLDAKSRHPKHDDVILWNDKGQLTESTVANLVLRFGEDYYTPPVACGLLNGSFRQSLIDTKTLKEKILYKEDLKEADEVLLVNSVRKWISVAL